MLQIKTITDYWKKKLHKVKIRIHNEKNTHEYYEMVFFYVDDEHLSKTLLQSWLCHFLNFFSCSRVGVLIFACQSSSVINIRQDFLIFK